ncbi:MAG: nitrogen fixation protein NifQ [Sulfuricellaceae bacterium]|nr:nitrogen fixation protein NifQ [Sulfuricellaceae bacterium]
MEILSYEWLMAHAQNPADNLTRAFAGVIHNSRRNKVLEAHVMLGLEEETFESLMENYFPGALQNAGMTMPSVTAAPGCEALRGDEFGDLLDLLLEHRTQPDQESEWLAFAIATACMGNDHLYQDMGLPNRQMLSELLSGYFTSLFVRNSGNMKWKKFFYKQLCDRTGVNACRAPSCMVCDDYLKCFGPEEGPAN